MFCGNSEAETVSEEKGSEPVIKKKSNTPIIIAIIALLVVVAAIVIATATSPSHRSSKQIDLGNKYLEELNYEQAVACFEAAIKIDPKNEKAFEDLVDTYIKWADQKAGDGDLDEAIELLENAVNSLGGMKTSDNAEIVDRYLQRIHEKLDELGTEREDLEMQEEKDTASGDESTSGNEDALANDTETGSEEDDASLGEDATAKNGDGDLASVSWSDWFDHSNPALNSYMEGLGYRYVCIHLPEDRNPGYRVKWVIEDWGEYSFYGLELEYTPDGVEYGFLENFYFMEGTHGSPVGMELNDHNMDVLLKCVKKHAEMYPSVSQRVKELKAQGIEIEYVFPENGSSWGGHFSDDVFQNYLDDFGNYLDGLGDFQEAQF